MRWLLLIALWCGGGCASAPVVYSRVTAVVSVWQLRTTFGSGSASVIACDPHEDGYRVVAVTAKHVLHLREINGFMLMLHQQNGPTLVGGKVLAVHPSEDVALVEFFALEPVPVIRVAGGPVEVMDELTVVGYAGGQGLRWISEGLACDPERATCVVAPGDSGGAVVNAAGELVGVVSGVSQLRTGQVITHHLKFVAVHPLREWLTRHQ